MEKRRCFAHAGSGAFFYRCGNGRQRRRFSVRAAAGGNTILCAGNDADNDVFMLDKSG